MAKLIMRKTRPLFLLVIILMFIPALAFGQIIDQVVIQDTDTGYKIEVFFFSPLRYQSHSPEKLSDVLEVQFRPERFSGQELEDQLDERITLSWDKKSTVPLREIVFDGELVESPSLIFRFTKQVEFSVKNSNDLRSVVVAVKTNKWSRKPAVKKVVDIPAEDLISQLKAINPELDELLDIANTALIEKEYSRAVQLFTRLRDRNEGEISQRAQELLGLAREYNGQLAHAKAEYEEYLRSYPDGDDARRVNQRLTSLITAARTPKERLKKGQRQVAQTGGKWNTQIYGGVSQTLFRDETTPDGEDSFLVRSDITTDLDFVGRFRKGNYDLKTQFIASYRKDLRSEGDDTEFIPSIVSFEARQTDIGLYARVGRQSRTTGGILGRFDGVHAAYEISPNITLNGVFGYPVNVSDKSEINTDQQFYGLSVDIATGSDKWDFNMFYIAQDNVGFTDREGVGGEVRYFDPTQSFFTLVDYDIFYNDLNIFLMVYNKKITDNTSFNFVLDYRNSPILTTTNAIQGQGVQTLDELSGLFSEEELTQLADDRTADSKSGTVGITSQLSKRWQITGEVTASEFGDTISSGGVEAIEGTGVEYLYSTQLIANSLFFDNDSLILGLRYSDRITSEIYTFNSSWRIIKSRKLRLNPRLRVDYRKDKVDGDFRWQIKPFFRLDYRFRRWMKLEFDIGYEWVDETFSGEPQTTNSYFLSLGYRAQF